MSGIFDRMNNPNSIGIDDQTLAPAYLCGVLVLKNLGLRTNQQLLGSVNAQLDASNPLNAEAIQDLQDIAAYIAAGTGEAGQIARLNRFCIVAGMWEQADNWGITEAEARTATGVTFTFGG